MDTPFHTELDVPVAGGTLRVGVAGPTGGAPVVLAVHGITGSHRSWATVSRHLGQSVTFLAPDLRGRCGSAGLSGPYGFTRHVEDLVAVLDHVGVARATLVGHSMGAYIATRFAASHPRLVASVVLVDGGLPWREPSEEVDIDEALTTTLGPALDRLRMTFPSREAYRDFWRAHPAFSGEGRWSPDVEDYIDYDLGDPDPATGELRSRVVEEAVRTDGRDVLYLDTVRRSALALSCPTVLLRAPWGLLDDPNPAITEETVAEAAKSLPNLVDVLVPETNHYMLVFGDREAAVVAENILAAAGADTG
jgi:pimeloyl-ACP methyl ester carboxylesterase